MSWFLPGFQVSLLTQRLGHRLSLLVLFPALHHFFDRLLQLSLNSHQLIGALVRDKTKRALKTLVHTWRECVTPEEQRHTQVWPEEPVPASSSTPHCSAWQEELVWVIIETCQKWIIARISSMLVLVPRLDL